MDGLAVRRLVRTSLAPTTRATVSLGHLGIDLSISTRWWMEGLPRPAARSWHPAQSHGWMANLYGHPRFAVIVQRKKLRREWATEMQYPGHHYQAGCPHLGPAYDFPPCHLPVANAVICWGLTKAPKRTLVNESVHRGT